MKRLLLVLLSMFALVPVWAGDIDNVGNLNDDEFQAFSADLGAALSYKSLTPTEPLGILGFDVAVDGSSTRVQAGAAWQIATGDEVSSLPMARIRVTKGLPFGFDVGGFYSTVPGSNIKLYGAELRYALVEGGVVTPAIGLRAAATRLNGVDDLAFGTHSLDISISKGLGPVTPYFGVGQVWVDNEYTGPQFQGTCGIAPTISCGGASASFNDAKYFAGMRISLLVLNLVVEGDRTGDVTTYSLKLGFGF